MFVNNLRTVLMMNTSIVYCTGHEEINRDYAIDFWAAEQFLTRDRGHGILYTLTEKSLVEKGEWGQYKMFVSYQRANEERSRDFFAQYDNGKKQRECLWVQSARKAQMFWNINADADNSSK
ncbi:hypothetical protein V6N13_100479 [Hibiscus sabdariffa]